MLLHFVVFQGDDGRTDAGKLASHIHPTILPSCGVVAEVGKGAPSPDLRSGFRIYSLCIFANVEETGTTSALLSKS